MSNYDVVYVDLKHTQNKLNTIQGEAHRLNEELKDSRLFQLKLVYVIYALLPFAGLGAFTILETLLMPWLRTL